MTRLLLAVSFPVIFSQAVLGQVTAEWTSAPSGMSWIRDQGLIVGGIAYKEFLITSGSGNIEVTAMLDVTGNSISTTMAVEQGNTYRAELVLDLNGSRSASNGEACFTATFNSSALNASGSHSLFALFTFPGTWSCPASITIAAQGTAVESESAPRIVRLLRNYPNPFANQTMISFDLEQPTYVRLNVYDLLGRHLDTIADELLTAGGHELQFDAQALPNGVYIYSLTASSISETRRMVVAR